MKMIRMAAFTIKRFPNDAANFNMVSGFRSRSFKLSCLSICFGEIVLSRSWWHNNNNILSNESWCSRSWQNNV